MLGFVSMEFLILSLVILGVVVLAVVTLKLFSISKTDQPLPYRAKQYFFSRSEQEFLRILNESLDRQRFVIFPKVRLADFIEVTIRGREYQGWLSKIKSKHVDFLIWDVKNHKIALAVELDGKSHNIEPMQTRDEFVNRLYDKVEIRLVRVKVGSNFLTEAKIISESLS